MKCNSLVELFSAVDVSCDKVRLPAANAVRDFMREHCIPGTLRPREPVPLSEEAFVRKMRLLGKVFGVENVPPEGCVALKEHAAYKAFSAAVKEKLPFFEKLPNVNFHLTDGWQFGSVLYSSDTPVEIIEMILAEPRLIGICQTVPPTEDRLIHFLLMRPEECSPLWLGLQALQTFAVEKQRRQNGFVELDLMREFFKNVLASVPPDKSKLEPEVESYRLIFLVLNQHLGGLLVPIVESYAVANADELKGLVDFILVECARAHGEPISAAEQKLREFMVRNAVLTRKVSEDKLVELLLSAAK